MNDYQFQQNSTIYCLRVKVFYKDLKLFVDFFETLTESVSYFEAEETNNIDAQANDLWQLEAYLDHSSDIKLLQKELAKIAKKNQIETPKVIEEKIINQDWVSKVQETFPPIESSLFFIHSSNYSGIIPNNKIIITMDAGCAFGTGEHETTSNCLNALSELKDYKFINSLDMGCGSGILAIAIAKLWPNQVTAVDIDEQAIKVARENFHINKVGFIVCEQGDGYNSDLVRKNASYQLIVANILANPLIEMAESAFNNLQNNGILILAGFIKSQEKQVLEAHEKQGFTLIKTIIQKDWPALVMKKG